MGFGATGRRRYFFASTRTRSLIPFFDKNKASAMQVLIFFSKNRITRRFDASIVHLRFDNHDVI